MGAGLGEQGGGKAGLWPLSERYGSVLKEVHHRQAPACGSPTLVWHMGLWPKRPFGERGAGAEVGESFRLFDEDQSRFFHEISDFAVNLQRLGRIKEPAGLSMTPASLPSFLAEGQRAAHPFLLVQPQAIAFTLWWNDEAGAPGVRNVRRTTPATSDLRVRVHLQTHRDHATLSFYVDIAKSYGAAQIDDPEVILRGGLGVRRLKLQSFIQVIRKVSGGQIREGWVEMARIPERGVGAEEARQLLEAADYCYQGVWEEFAEAFAIQAPGAGAEEARFGERFADFRGLVMSIRGLDSTPQEEVRQQNLVAIRKHAAAERRPEVVAFTDRTPPRDVPDYTSGTTGFGPLAVFDTSVNEKHTVAKSLWPFLRRMTPWADYSDWVGCGIASNRAIYLTAMGSAAAMEGDSEEYGGREQEVPAGFLPASEQLGPEQRRGASLRYLIVTKGEPLREQMGRFVERINALGTMRLFALRDLSSIRNAGMHIEVLGRMLDGTLQEWESERKRIDDEYVSTKAAIRARLERRHGRSITENQKLREDLNPRMRGVEELHIRQLNSLIRKTERKVIQIAGHLDMIGEGGSGRMIYAINRAVYYMQEFLRLHNTLAVDDIPGWVSYQQFVSRSVQPSFNVISSTGERLRSIRDRIAVVTETIQTAALIVETAATRENTAMLKRIAGSFLLLRFGLLGLAAIIVKFLFDVASGIVTTEQAFDWLRRMLPQLFTGG